MLADSSSLILVVLFVLQEAENARVNLFELRAVTAAVESSGQKKAEAQVSRIILIRNPPLFATLKAAVTSTFFPCTGYAKYVVTIEANQYVFI